MATTASELRDAIVAADKRFMESYNAGDAAGVAECYTEGGQLLPPNSEPVTGKPAIQAFWQGAMDMGITRVTLETVEVEAAGETAYEVGTVHPRGKRQRRRPGEVPRRLEARRRRPEAAPRHLVHQPSCVGAGSHPARS